MWRVYRGQLALAQGAPGGNVPGVGECHVRFYRGQLVLAQGTPGGNLPGDGGVMSGCIEDN